MYRKFPPPFRRIIFRVKLLLAQWRYHLNRYNNRPQFRTRTSPSHLLASRPAQPRGVATHARTSRKRYTTVEVKAYLQGSPPSDKDRLHTIANQFQMARLSEILDRPIPRRFYGREWLYQRLIMVTTRYSQKVPPEEIADSLSFFYKADDIEEAIEYVSNLVAESLNRANAWF